MSISPQKRELTEGQVRRCENARYSRCRCRCGGAAHGRNHYLTPSKDNPHKLLSGQRQMQSVEARRVKQRCDFFAIASRYTRLRRAGRQYVALCPFHSERHPSFYVELSRKVFYCFGCGVGGDVFDFIMRAERCDFSRALELVEKFSNGGSAPLLSLLL